MIEPGVWGVGLLLLVAGLGLGLRRRLRRPDAAWPLPERWRTRLYERVPQTAWVPRALRSLYESRVEIFLGRTRFVPCGGLAEVTDEQRLAVAGYAGLLLLRADAQVFPALRSVLIYPDAFLVPQTEPDEIGLVSDDPEERLGESWEGERIVLSWADVEAAMRGDAVNVVVHEFAHQLDDEMPGTEGAPRLHDYTRWSTVMRVEYERLQRHRRPPVLDPYGAQSPAEFFGVVTEAFFQRPAELQRHHAELYALLADYYRLDPVALAAG
ncbi:MAG TPA: M90 family metallopeptidase [Solimonas sp.]|nr:M90 family metallopeptidase [Solimonas sp.]